MKPKVQIIPPAPRARWRGWLIIVLIGVAWFGYGQWSYRRVVPPAHVRNFDSLTEWRTPRRLVMFEAQGRTWLMAYGPSVGLLPSGPSAYVFDDRGTLVSWAADSGDAFDFQRRWQDPPGVWASRREVSLDEARAWLTNGAAATRRTASSSPAR